LYELYNILYNIVTVWFADGLGVAGQPPGRPGGARPASAASATASGSEPQAASEGRGVLATLWLRRLSCRVVKHHADVMIFNAALSRPASASCPVNNR